MGEHIVTIKGKVNPREANQWSREHVVAAKRKLRWI